MKNKKFDLLKNNLFIYNMYNSVGDFIILTNFIEKYNFLTKNNGVFFGFNFGVFYEFNFLYTKRFPFIKLLVLKKTLDIFYFLFFILFSYFKKSYIVIFSHKSQSFKIKIFYFFLIYFTRIQVINYSLSGSKLFINKKFIKESEKGLFYNDMFNLILEKLNLTKKEVLLSPLNTDLSILNKHKLNIEKYFVINLGSAKSFKNRIIDNWICDIKFILDNYKEFKIVFVGTGDQYIISKNIINFFRKDYDKGIFLNLIDQINVDEILSIISKAKIFIGLQSGLSHIAYRQNVPSILFSISTEKYYNIINKNVINLINLENCKCKENNFEYCVSKDYYACLKEINILDFQTAIKRLFRST